MRRFVVIPYLSATLLMAVCGCADLRTAQLTKLQENQIALQGQSQEWQKRATELDGKNQDLHSLVAQSQQRSQALQDQLSGVQNQLRDVNLQLVQARNEKKQSDEKVKTMTASMQRSGGVSISANSSIPQALPPINIPGVQVRRDGDVVRVELPGPQLFESGSATLRPGASNMIGLAASQLARMYPDHPIGVEGHTDNDSIRGRQWRNNHELSLSRAMAVYDVVTANTNLRPEQLKVVGHGSNRPVFSNETQAGKQRNRRVELVIYPKRAP